MKFNQMYWAIVYDNNILEGYEGNPFVYLTRESAIDMYDWAISCCGKGRGYQGHSKEELLKSKILPIKIIRDVE